MKKIKLVAAVAAIAGLAIGVMTSRATLIWGTLSTLTTGTNYSSTIPAFTVAFPGKTIDIQHGGLAHTNDLPVWLQVSLGVDSSGNTNYVTVAGPWYPPLTNAGTYHWSVPGATIQVYGRGYSIQTNTVSV